MIEKKIHYCWFGKNPKNELILKCIESWKKYCPDYEIIEWNEDSFDVNECIYTKEAYENKKWAFITDYVRLKVLHDFGGVYLDTDVELIKSIDVFLEHNAFSGFEDNKYIPTGLMGAKKNDPWIKILLDYYDDRSFYLDDGSLDLIPNTRIITEISEKHFDFDSKNATGNDLIVLKNHVYLYPWFYFCPKSHLDGKVRICKDTYSIHHFNGSWLPKHKKVLMFFSKLFVRMFGKETYYKIRQKLFGR
ncbi:TPA: glycosyltransferase family 32 protein [Photobacterium damselae]